MLEVSKTSDSQHFFLIFQVIDDFVKSVKETDITIISQEIFQHDPLTRIENLKVSSISGSRDGGGSDPPMENAKNIEFLSNTWPVPLKKNNTKLPSQHSILGHYRHTSETPFKRRFPGGPMMTRLQWYLLGSSLHTKKEKKNLVKVGPPLTKLSFWIRARVRYM